MVRTLFLFIVLDLSKRGAYDVHVMCASTTLEVISSFLQNPSDTEEETAEESPPCSLSGIPSLYTGLEQESDESPNADTLVDMETIWGQVDLQNNALLPRLKKLIRRLNKVTDGEDSAEVIRLLDMGDMESEEEEQPSEEEDIEQDGESMEEGSAASNLDEQDENSDEEDLDEDARRIRERMKKAMASMNDDSQESDQDSKTERLKDITSKCAELESMLDPTREEMHDGFFDLHEMEAFADEEEEMLPDDAYGTEMPDDGEFGGKKTSKSKKRVLPHIKARKGQEDSDSEVNSDDEDSDDGLTKRFKPNSIRRKKYRADDEVEALYELYNDKQEDEFDDSDEEREGFAPEDMTAADFFGKPDKKLIERYKSQQLEGAGKAAAKGGLEFDDADSWDNHNFAEDGEDWKCDNHDDEAMGGEGSEEDEDPPEEDESGDDNQPDKFSGHALQSKKLEQHTLRRHHLTVGIEHRCGHQRGGLLFLCYSG